MRRMELGKRSSSQCDDDAPGKMGSLGKRCKGLRNGWLRWRGVGKKGAGSGGWSECQTAQQNQQSKQAIACGSAHLPIVSDRGWRVAATACGHGDGIREN